MKRFILTLLLTAAFVATYAGQPPVGMFTWGLPTPITLAYTQSDTLSVNSPLSGYTVTYELVDQQFARYISIQGNIITCIRNYTGVQAGEQTGGGTIYIRARITNIPGYDDTELTTFVNTRRIDPLLRWTAPVLNMRWGESQVLHTAHSNTDDPSKTVTYDAGDAQSRPSSRVAIDQTTGTITALAIGTGITITAHLDTTNNYNSATLDYPNNSTPVLINISRADRPLSWNPTDLSALDNRTNDRPLAVTYPEQENDPVLFSTSDTTIATIVNLRTLHILRPGRVTLSASVPQSNHYEALTSDTVLNIQAIPTTLAWEEAIIDGLEQYNRVTSVTDSFDLRQTVTSNYGFDASYHFSIPAQYADRAEIIDGCLLRCYQPGVIELECYAQSAAGSSPTIRHTLNIARGRLRFTRDGLWNDLSCWSRSDIQPDTALYGAEITGRCTIPAGLEAHSRDIVIYSGGALVVEPAATLLVADTLFNYGGENNLILLADSADYGRIVLHEGMPRARVERWIQAGDSVEFTPAVAQTYFREQCTVEQWVDSSWQKLLSAPYRLEAFEVYRLSGRGEGITANIGIPVTGNHLYQLPAGLSPIANSYAAPIPGSAFAFGDDVRPELYFRHNGRYLSSPAMTARAVGRSADLASGSVAYLLSQRDSATVAVDYETAMAVRSSDDLAFDHLNIIMSAGSVADTLFLLAGTHADSLYNAGYDGTLISRGGRNAELYVSHSWGETEIDVDAEIVGRKISMRAPQAVEYTISFETNVTDQLYLLDNKTFDIVDITAGEQYHIAGAGDEPQRFSILATMPDAPRDKDGRAILVLGDRAVLLGEWETGMTVILTNFQGQIIAQYKTDGNSVIRLPQLTSGLYILHAGKTNTKFFRR